MSQPELTVRQVMHADPITVRPDAPVQDVLRLMNLHRIGAAVVAGPDDRLAGIFTERDLLRRVAGAEVGWRVLPVSDWMTADPYTIGPDVGWDDAVELMTRLRVRHLPVVEHGRVIGLISTRMLMGRRAEYLNHVIEERTRELRRVNDELLARDAEMRHYLRASGRLQTKLLLPHAPPDWPELGWGVHYAPLDHLGGDYYDFAAPGPDHLGILIADASGHSIPAALVAVMARIAFGEVAGTTVSPGEVLTAVNARLQGLIEERFVTAFYGVLDRRTGRFTYANAGHPYPLRLSATTGKVQPLSASGFILGIMPDEIYRERAVQLEPGDRVCFYTDGLVEARNEIGEAYETERLEACLRANHGLPAGDLAAAVLAGQQGFIGSQPVSDDITVLVAEMRG